MVEGNSHDSDPPWVTPTLIMGGESTNYLHKV